MKPLLYDLIKQDFMNLEKGKILCFDQIKAKVQTDKTITVTAAQYFNSPNSFNINSVQSIEFGTFPDSSETKQIFNIEVGKPGSTTYYNIDIINSGNKSTVVDKIRSTYDYEYTGDRLESIEALNEFLNNTPILNGVTLKSSLQAGGNTLNITQVDCSEDTFNSILQTIKFKLSQTYKAKITNQYVWVTPNTIDPRQHDMIVYDITINGTQQQDQSYGSFVIDEPFSTFRQKIITGQISGDYVDPYKGYALNLLTGQYNWDAGLGFPYINYIYERDGEIPYQAMFSGITLGEEVDLYELCGPEENSSVYTYVQDYAEIDGQYINIPYISSDTDWITNLGTENFKLNGPIDVDKFDLSWLAIKTKILTDTQSPNLPNLPSL